ncbi:MFS transporter [Vibrio cholerae]|uniref:MFS transporter n=1 Tax=Vibrio cholerae TaxID=666 RepID=UPI000BA989DD|nr:MFS transporter [Vibrio cholerae]EKF9936218.1 MFS transporter [Vibrio cholerae]PAR84425.1 hypothetical protein CGT85_03275 [Vibrio cholerae]
MIFTSDFWKLRLAEALYLISSRVVISVVVLMLILTEEYYISSLFLFLFFLFKSLSGIFLAGKLDKYSKKKSLIAFSSMFLICSILLSLLFGYDLLNIFTLSLISLLLALVDSSYSSITDAYIPLVVKKEKLEEAYRKTSMIQSFIDLFGITIGMVGVELIGFQNVLLVVVVVSFLTITVLVGLTNIDHMDNVDQYESFSIRESFRLFFHYKFEPRWALLSLLINMILLPFSMMIIPYYVSNILNESPIYIGIIEASASFGVLIASLYLHRVITSVLGNSRTISLAFALIGISLIAMAYTISIYYWILLAFSIGAAIVLNNVTIESKRAAFIPQEHRVKIQTIHSSFINLANPIGFLIMGNVLSNQNYNLFLLVGGALIFIQSFIVYTLPNFKEIAEGTSTKSSYKDIYGEQ